MSTIELADFPAFRRAALRSRLLQFGLAALVLAFAAFAFASTPRRAVPDAALLPQGTSGIVVIDVSASISWDTYARIASTLDRLRRGGGSAGLVLFSDTAYQALPPGTPVAEIGRFERFFRVTQPSQPGVQPQPPTSPWTDSFSAGTRISTGLRLALDVVQREQLRKPIVLLVSDLDDDATDLESVTSVALAYRRLGIPIKIVGLNAAPADAQYMQRLLPQGSSVIGATLPRERGPGAQSGVPTTVIVFAVLLALAIAAYLVVTERLRWSAA